MHVSKSAQKHFSVVNFVSTIAGVQVIKQHRASIISQTNNKMLELML